MKVIDIARAANVPANTVRFYVRTGLLSPSRNPMNGYKIFSRDDLTRLLVIRQAQTLGYTLAEIVELLRQMERGDLDSLSMYQTLHQHISEIQSQPMYGAMSATHISPER